MNLFPFLIDPIISCETLAPSRYVVVIATPVSMAVAQTANAVVPVAETIRAIMYVEGRGATGQ